ncbi:lipopolysaccharide biosynthesis protein [Aliarcobacter lanthieri]|uniref:lipopolysaccharide biosynthesis protein n=1 Tax=Aliarcobacter lanthieri TaxID=1355374 RepID=UPI000479A4FB|nr:oligosaccharide flippase family protein [Aliarcobacter lanthieri]QKF58962.1 putative flippase [Aliarcobacter lanthieri]
MIIRNSIIFIFFELINKSIPFLLLPILTRFLTPDDYGIIASFTALVSFLAIFIGLSGHGAIDANFFRLEKNKLGIYIANVLIILLLTTFLSLVSVLLFSDFIESKLYISLEWQILGIIVALGQFITLINLSLWVIEQRPLQFGIYQFLQTILITVISIILIIGYSYNWQGQIIGIIIGTLLFSFFSLIILFKRGYMNLKIDKLYIKDFLKFGIPMVPHQLSAWLRTQGDKFIIISILGSATTGLFSVGQQMGLVMSILMSSLNKALYPILFQILSNEMTKNSKNKLVKISYLLFLLIAFIGFILMILLQLLYPYFLGKEFQNSLFLTQLIVLGFILEGFYYVVVNYIFYFKKTASLAKITFFVSIIHIIMSFLFVKLFGINGVGYALIISGIIQFILIWYLSNKIYSMPWFSFWRKDEI